MAIAMSRARTEMRDLLSACRAVEERRRGAFEVDVGEAMAKASQYFSVWQDVGDLRLDAAVLNGLARVIQIQEARLRYEAGLFLADPQFLASKLPKLPQDALADALLASWHPVAALEQITERGLEIAKRYFDGLRPWSERTTKEPAGRPPEARSMTESDLAALGVVRREGFLGFLGDLWDELKAAGSTDYRAFVDRGDRVQRAYGAAFLVSYGYAELLDADGHTELRANPERIERRGCRSAITVLGGGA